MDASVSPPATIKYRPPDINHRSDGTTPVYRYHYCPECDNAFGGPRCTLCGKAGVPVVMQTGRKVPIVLVLAVLALVMATAVVYLIYGDEGEWGTGTCCMYCGASVLFVIALIYVGWKLMAYRFRNDMEAALEAGRRSAAAAGRPPGGAAGAGRRRDPDGRDRGPGGEEVVDTDARVLVECPGCGASISENARRCPHCGRLGKRMKKAYEDDNADEDEDDDD
jgi:hypothetical protein